MPTKAQVIERRQEILAVAQRFGATDVRLFGSLARGDADDASDVDLLVRFEPGRSLLDQGGLLMELRALLGTSVDVVSEGALTGRFGTIVRREAVPLRDRTAFGCEISSMPLTSSTDICRGTALHLITTRRFSLTFTGT